jgi:hypothetical protein
MARRAESDAAFDPTGLIAAAAVNSISSERRAWKMRLSDKLCNYQAVQPTEVGLLCHKQCGPSGQSERAAEPWRELRTARRPFSRSE